MSVIAAVRLEGEPSCKERREKTSDEFDCPRCSVIYAFVVTPFCLINFFWNLFIFFYPFKRLVLLCRYAARVLYWN